MWLVFDITKAITPHFYLYTKHLECFLSFVLASKM